MRRNQIKKNTRGNAILRTQALKNQNYAQKRIMRDLKEIENETIPTVGVVAKPLESSVFKWHGNITAPKGTYYEGAVFHIEIEIPQNYPHCPPKITMPTPPPHMNIYGNQVCLDMLQPYRSGEGDFGWSSAYTIQSILIQLQSFLSETTAYYFKNEKTQEFVIKNVVKYANEYQCRTCKHGGKLSAWPQLKKYETEEEIEYEFMTTNYNENRNFSKEIICYHTKESFKPEQQSEESADEDGSLKIKNEGRAIGLGLSVSKVPRTGNIKEAITTLDFISIRAYIKEGIRWSSTNDKFTNWLPLYFGKEDNEDRFYNLVKKSLSFIMVNSTKRFEPEFILKIYPQILVTLIVSLADEQRFPSQKIIRQIGLLHCSFLALLEKHPELYDQIEQNLQNFIQNPEKRVKDHTPNLAQLYVYLLVSPKTQLKDIIKLIHQESLDRQVFWILQQVPELLDEKNIDGLNKKRAELTFKCQKTSYHITCLFTKLYQIIRGSENNFKSPTQMFQEYKNQVGKLRNAQEDEFQSQCKHIRDNIWSYEEYYDYLGFEKKTNKQLGEILKQSIQNSLDKKYHGEEQEVNKLPSVQEQMRELFKNQPQIQDFYEVNSQKQEKTHIYTVKPKKQLSESEWKDLCVQRWVWVKDALKFNQSTTPTELAYNQLEQFTRGFCDNKENQKEEFQNSYILKTNKYENPEYQITELNWMQLFMKLDFEQFLSNFDRNPDFELLYSKIQIIKDHITFLSISIPTITTTEVKSGYYYLVPVIQKLQKLEFLAIVGKKKKAFAQKVLQNLFKGINNFIADGGKLKKISFNNFKVLQPNIETTDKVFSPLLKLKTLESIEFRGSNILLHQSASKALGNLIQNQKNLQELKLSYLNINETNAKEIADSLMRAQKLRYITITGISEGLQAFVYTLAFAGSLEYLNISMNTAKKPADLAESLYKLIKINGSIEFLNVSGIANFNSHYKEDFFKFIGYSKSLRQIQFQNSGKFSSTQLSYLGKAIAFNAKKNNQLQNINLQASMDGTYSVENLYNGMNVSEYDDEMWYGDQIKAKKMEKEDLAKHFFNNLQALEFNNCPNIMPSFNYTNFMKQPEKTRVIPKFAKLLMNSKNIDILQLSGCNIQNNQLEILQLALDQSEKEVHNKIKVIDLSKNNLGKQGAKALQEILKTKNSIETLDISKNKLSVSCATIFKTLEDNKTVKNINLFNNNAGYDSAVALGKVLEKNTTLEYLDLGHNRIRNKGLSVLVQAINKNPNNNLKGLGLRFNYLNEDSIMELMKSKNVSKLRQVLIKNNRIDLYNMNKLREIHQRINSNFQFDLFDKFEYLEESKLERTIYIFPCKVYEETIVDFFQNQKKCGIVLDVRIRDGPKWPNRTTEKNRFAMVEFADSISCNRALQVASKKKAIIQGQKLKVYKAGTGTYVYAKETSKQKKALTAKNEIPTLVKTETNSRYITDNLNTQQKKQW